MYIDEGNTFSCKSSIAIRKLEEEMLRDGIVTEEELAMMRLAAHICAMKVTVDLIKKCGLDKLFEEED